MSHYKTRTHDCVLEDIDGNEIGLTLAKEKDGITPIYRESGDETLSQQMYVGLSDYAHAPPHKRIQIGQSDYRGGMGKEFENYLTQDALKYYYAMNLDLRFKGMAIPAPLPVAIAANKVPANLDDPTITNADMELDANWTGGAQNGDQKNAGDYSWRVTDDTEAYQDLSWSNTYRGRGFEVKCYVYAAQATSGRIGIDDGIGVTYSDYNDGDSDFDQETVYRSLSPNATRLRIIFQTKDSGNGAEYAYFDDVTITAENGQGTTTCWKEFDDKLFANSGKILIKQNSSGDGFDAVYEFEHTISSLEVFQYAGDDFLFIGQGTGNKYFYMPTVPTIVNADMELDANWTNDGATTSERSNTQNHTSGGTYSWKLIDTGVCNAYQDLTSYAPTAIYELLGYIYSDGTNDAKIAIDDGQGTTASDAVTAAEWTFATLTRTLDASASQLRVELQITDGEGATAYFDDLEIYVRPVISSVTNAEADFLITMANSSGTALYLVELPNELRKSTNPINGGSWGGITYVGDAAKDVTDLQKVDYSGDTFLVVLKENAGYMIDNSGIPRSRIPQLRVNDATTTGKNSYVHGNALLIPAGAQSLWEWEDGAVTSLAPSEFINNASEFDGRILGVTGDDRYVYTFVANGTKIEVLAGRWEDVNGEDWRWHGSLAEITLAGVESCCVSSVYKKRLWIASTNSAQLIYYMPLYTQYGNPATDADMSFQTGGYFVTDWRFANFRDDLKAFTRFNSQVDNVDATNYWTVYYQKWEDAGWTEIDDFGDDEVEIESAYIPVDGSGNKPETELMRYKIACTSDGAVPCPIFRHWTCDGIWYPSYKSKIITMQVRCADKLKIKHGIDENQTQSDIAVFLDSAYNPSTAWPLNFYPPDWKSSSDTKTVKMIEPYDFFYTMIKKRNGERKFEGTFTLTLEEVTLS